MKFLTLFKDLSAVAPYAWMFSVSSIILVFLGWRVAYRNSAKLATRSETKSLIDAISKLVNEISDISIDYWINKSAKKSEILSSSKIRGLNRVKRSIPIDSNLFLMNVLAKANQSARYISILKHRGIVLNDGLLATALEKATLDCEVASTFSKDDKAIRAQEIMGACMDAIATLYEVFQDYHPPSSLLTWRERYLMKCKELEEWNKSLGW